MEPCAMCRKEAEWDTMEEWEDIQTGKPLMICQDCMEEAYQAGGGNA